MDEELRERLAKVEADSARTRRLAIAALAFSGLTVCLVMSGAVRAQVLELVPVESETATFDRIEADSIVVGTGIALRGEDSRVLLSADQLMMSQGDRRISLAPGRLALQSSAATADVEPGALNLSRGEARILLDASGSLQVRQEGKAAPLLINLEEVGVPRR